MERRAVPTARTRGLILIAAAVFAAVSIPTGTGRAPVDEARVEPGGAPARLYQNYPDPFNPRTMIPFSLDRRARVTLTVYDEQNRRVKTLLDRRLPPGNYRATWNGRDGRGVPVRAGLYYYRLRAGGALEEGTAVVVK